MDVLIDTAAGDVSRVVRWGSAERTAAELRLVGLAYEVSPTTEICSRCGSPLRAPVRVTTWPTLLGPVLWRVSGTTRCQGWRRRLHTANIGFLIVRWRIGRAAGEAVEGDRLGALAHRVCSGGTLAAHALAMGALLALIRLPDGHRVAVAGALTLGALHMLFDGFIWRSRERGGASGVIGPPTSARLPRPVAVADPCGHGIGS